MNRLVVSVVLIAVAIVFFAMGRYSGVHQPPVGPRGPIAVGASIDIKCGDTKITVSTGNNKGECETGGGPPANNAGCTDGKNSASASCVSGCNQSAGSGSCKITRL
jgi:hypothetical protein